MKGKCKKILSLALALALVVQMFFGMGNVARAATVTSLTLKGLGGWNASANGSTPEQIGFKVNETIANGGSWLNATITNGQIERNGVAEDGWRIQTTDADAFVLAHDTYVPVVNDIIKIPAGVQFTINSAVYEFANTYTIKYNGSSWAEYVPAETLTITGRFADLDQTNPLQLAFLTSEKISVFEEAWLTCNITSGSVKLNGQVQSGWQITIAGTNHLLLVCNQYTPAENDVIEIEAGTQFTYQTSVLEISNDFTIKYNGSSWAEYVPAETLTITGRFADLDQTNPLQLAFLTSEKISVFEEAWLTCNITSGSVKLNGQVQSGWQITIAGTNHLLLVCNQYTPAENDVIEIEAGTQFTYQTSVLEISNDFTIKYDGTAWNAYTRPDATLVLGQLQDASGTVDHPSDANRILYRLYIASNQTGTVDWVNADDNAELILNGNEPFNGSVMWSDTAGTFFVQIDVERTKNIESITIPKDAQYTINNVLYEVSADYTAYYYENDFYDKEQVLPTELTLGALNVNDSKVSVSGDNATYGIYIQTNQATTVGWSDADNGAELILNGDEDFIGAIMWGNDTGLLYVQFTVEADKNVETITIPQGAMYTMNNIQYEITADYTVYYYSNGFHDTAKPTAIPVTPDELIVDRSVRKEGSNGYIYQIYIKTNHFDAPASWTGNDNSATLYLNGETATGAVTWDDNVNGILFAQLDLTTDTVVNTVTLKKGTQYTINNILYEIAEDYTIYHKNGKFASSMLYEIKKTVNGEAVVETVSGDYTLPEAEKKEGYITLGWSVDGSLYKVGTVLPAKSEGYVIDAVDAQYSQIDGAQVRLTAKNVNEEIGGIRFISKLGADSKSEYIIEMGMLIIPTDYMTNGELTHDNYDPQIEDWSNEGYREFVVSNEEMNLEVFEQDEEANGVESYYLKAAIVNLYEYNYTRSYSARSFLKVNYADGVGYIYTDYDPDNNARRICDIAKKMIETYPEKYAPFNDTRYPIVYEYAKVADTMESFAFYGPQVVVTDGVYDVAATKTAMQAYADLGFKYFATEGEAGYHVDNTFGTTTLEEEQNVYDNPRLPSHNLKQTMKIARECGLEVLVLDWSLNKLSACDIPLVETSSSSGQVLAMCLETTDGKYPELIGSGIDETLFDETNRTYTYNGSTARVLHYVKQFKTYDDLKAWVAIKMSAYAKEKNFRGVRLDDEPAADMFAAMALMTKVIKELYPDAYVQTSSLPNYHFESGGNIFSGSYNDGYSTWKNYWNQLMDAHSDYTDEEGNLYVTEGGINFYPYALWKKGIINIRYDHELRTNYLTSLQYLANTTRDNGINLEMTVQTFAVDELYANVSAADLYLQTHLALAFGAKTMGYFRYTGKGQIETAQTDRYINQDIVSDTNLSEAVLYANKNGNYIKAHMTFFKYDGSKVYGNSTYVTPNAFTSINSEDWYGDFISVSSDAAVLANQFYNEHTDSFGYYVVNLAQLNNTDGSDVTNPASVTITLSQPCKVYKDYKNYTNEAANKVTTVTLEGGQGAFIVVE